MPEQLKTLYKLMTMYTLSRVDFALTNSQITNVFLDLGYTNYFNVQYTLGDLVSSGRKALEALKNSIAVSIRSDIDTYLQANRLEFREALATRSEYYRTTEGDYAVRCRVMEHNTALIDLTLTVPNETQAKIVSKEWKEKSQDVYAYVMRTLTQPDHIDRLLESDDSGPDA